MHLSNAYRTGYYENKPEIATYVELSYTCEGEEAVTRQAQTLSAAQELAHQANLFWDTPLEKELFLHDVLCEETVYLAESPDPYSAAGPLLEGHAVC